MMTPYMQQIVNRIAQRIADLSGEMLIETNDGTYGAAECCRKTGSGDPVYGNYRVYEALDGSRRVAGCDPARAPGYARKLNAPTAAARRAEIAELRSRLETLKTWPGHEPLPARAVEFAS